MSVQKISVMVPPLPTVPPGAAWAAAAAGWLLGGDPAHPTGVPAWFATLRRHQARRRAARHEARDRLALLALARRHAASQPEFAKDLLAAANAERRP
jgi:hypothetical protein